MLECEGGPKSRANATPKAQSGGPKEATKAGRRARIQVNRAETGNVSGANAAAVPLKAGPPQHKALCHRRTSYEPTQAKLYLCPELMPGPSADSGVPPNTNERPGDMCQPLPAAGACEQEEYDTESYVGTAVKILAGKSLTFLREVRGWA